MASTVARLGATTNVVHGFIYFASDASNEYAQLGLTGRQQYFAGRSAPMGAVGPEVVVATFYNFNPDVIHAAIPNAWQVAAPEAIQQARFRAASTVLHSVREAMNSVEVARATAITEEMVRAVGDEGKVLAAANRAVELPADPLLRLWQLVTTMREWRGDAHVAALTCALVTGLEALVLHAATGQVPAGALRATRAWSESQWQHGVASLAKRGLVQDDGSFTDAGRSYRAEIEATTNRAAQPLVDAVGDLSANELCDLLKPLRDALIGTGIFGQPLGGTSDQT